MSNKGRPKNSKNRKPQHIWSEEEKDYLKEIVTGNGYQKITDMMNEKFEYQFEIGQIRGAIKRYNLITGIGGNFPKGFTPWNKGKKGYMGANRTSFKKGNIPQQYREVGSERISKDGYTYIKVADPNKWKLKHRLIYEEHHDVKLSSNETIIFLDSDKTNLNIDNLHKVTRSQLARINQHNLIRDDPELTKVGVRIAEVIEKCGEVKRKKIR